MILDAFPSSVPPAGRSKPGTRGPFAPSAADVLRPTSLPGDRTSPVLDRRPLSIEVPPEAPENLHVHQDRGRFVGIF